MKNSKVILAAVIGSLMSVSAMANNLTGTVNFTGNLVAAPCQIDAGSRTIDIDFDSVIVDGANIISPVKDGEIKLHNCNFAGLPGVTRVEVKFSGDADPNTQSLLRVNGHAKGVGIRFMKEDGADFDIRNEAVSIHSANNDLSIKFKTKVERTAGNLAYGGFAATATYNIDYK